VRGFPCKIATTMAQRSSRPSEDEAASDAAFTYLIGLYLFDRALWPRHGF
jgi:hypothetical protein